MLRALLVGSVAIVCATAGLVREAQPVASTPSVMRSAPGLARLLGYVDSRLVRIDPEVLRPLAGRGVPVGPGGCAPRSGGTACWSTPPWTASPDGRRLALARNDVSSLQVVDVRDLRVDSRLRWGLHGMSIGALAWIGPRRVLGVQETIGERQRLVVFDLVEKRAVGSGALGGRVMQLAKTAAELVLLVAPHDTIGSARVAVANRKGVVRFTRLERIQAGVKLLGTGSQHRVDSRSPGLAVDPQRRRAFVVAQDLLAEIDLRTLAVAYHSLVAKPSLVSRLWSWLEPAALAKQVSGYHRQARWLGTGVIAVSGTDTDDGRYRPSGLVVIEPDTWSVRAIDKGAMSFAVEGDTLLATGGSWDAATKRATGIGLAAYGFDGAEQFRLFDGEHVWLAQAYRGRAYAGLAGRAESLHVVDLAAGSVIGMREAPLPWLLLGQGSGWWG